MPLFGGWQPAFSTSQRRRCLPQLYGPNPRGRQPSGAQPPSVVSDLIREAGGDRQRRSAAATHVAFLERERYGPHMRDDESREGGPGARWERAASHRRKHGGLGLPVGFTPPSSSVLVATALWCVYWVYVLTTSHPVWLRGVAVVAVVTSLFTAVKDIRSRM